MHAYLLLPFIITCHTPKLTPTGGLSGGLSLSTMPSVVEEVMNNENGSLSANAADAAAEPWQKHNGRLSATDRPFVIDSEPPESETKFEDVVDQVTLY